ncbi:MAG: ribonuclease domain-containing protein [Elusimicrobiales bacterium]|jgi:guanyl-specific ribonuclease Sa
MLKTKVLFSNAVVLSAFVCIFSASGRLAAQASPRSEIKNASAVELLAEINPSPDLVKEIASKKIAAAHPVAGTVKLIAPGSDLAPKVEDPARVDAILKLVSDIFFGEPLPYSQDGAIFTNREGILPEQPRDFYKEYTLLTGDAPHSVVIGGQAYQVAPDLSARGSERVIIGGGEFLYYTPDHYKTFIQLTVIE